MTPKRKQIYVHVSEAFTFLDVTFMREQIDKNKYLINTYNANQIQFHSRSLKML